MNSRLPSRPRSRTAPPEAIWHLFLRCMGLVRRILEPQFVRFGVSGPQWGVLRALQRAEDGGEKSLPLNEIGRRLLIQPPSVTGVVDRLERLGFVERSDSRDDRRVRRVALTRAGRKLVGEVLETHPERIGSLFAGLSLAEQESRRSLLERVQGHLETQAPNDRRS